MTRTMSNNKLYLVFPAETEYTKYSDVDLHALIKDLDRTLFLINHEEFDGYYCNKSFKAFYFFVKERDSNLSVLLMKILNDWIPVISPDIEEGVEFHISGRDDTEMSVPAFYSSPDHAAVLSMTLTGKAVDIIRVCSHGTVRIKSIICTESSLYLWFCENRSPQRELHSEYKKHSRFGSTIGKKGVVVSAFTYTEDEAKRYLHMAVGTSSPKRYVLNITSDRKILVFFNQDHTGTAFHAYQTDENDNAEISKYGNTALKKMKRLKKLGLT